MKKTQSRLVLLLVFALFGIPVVVATLMHSPWWQYRPSGMINRGTLVQPPVVLDYAALDFTATTSPDQAAAGKWVILYPVTTPCNGACRSDIESLRQIHRAAGRRQQQLAVAPLMPAGAGDQSAALQSIYESFLPAQDRDGRVFEVLRSIAETGPEGALLDGQVFLADPSGNIMMRYAPGFDPGDLNKDLKRLLKWSAQDG